MEEGRGGERDSNGNFQYFPPFTSLHSLASSVTRKKPPNVYKSCPKIISLEK